MYIVLDYVISALSVVILNQLDRLLSPCLLCGNLLALWQTTFLQFGFTIAIFYYPSQNSHKVQMDTYGVSLLTPIHFRVPSLIFGPLVAKYLVENGVSRTF